MIYLDYNATTPVDPRVLDAMLPYFREQFGNAASKTHALGWIAEEAVKQSRQQVAELIGCTDQEIIFTSGATESLNLAIKGLYHNYQTKGRHIVTVATEHKAVLDTCEELQKQGADISILPVSRDGLIDLEMLEKCITEQTILVSVMFANNETGVLQPIKKIAEIVHSKKSMLLCDATQAIGKVRIDVEEEGIDLLCVSAHKFYGPKGAGALYVRRKNPRVSLLAQQHGGGHERGLRSGTLNVPGIVGLGKACDLARIEMWEDAVRISKLRTVLEQHVCDLPQVYINGTTKHRLFNVTNLLCTGIRADELIMKCKNIAMATGSACSSADMEPSHVLRAMGLTDKEAKASIRLSLGKYTTEEEVKDVISSLQHAITQLRSSLQ